VLSARQPREWITPDLAASPVPEGILFSRPIAQDPIGNGMAQF
jgi:hypothetical protein